jgi:undecaprenyl-diphosphatase
VLATLVPVTVLLGVLSVKVEDRVGPLRIDDRVDARLIGHLGRYSGLFHRVVQLGSPTGVAVLSSGLALLCLVLRRPRGAVLVGVGPPVAGTLTEYVLKPLIHRHDDGRDVFPSGHTTGAVALAVALILLVLPGGALSHVAAALRLLLAALVALLLVVPLGMVVLQAHFVTDVLAGGATAGVVIVLLALGLDLRRRRPA